ncbi:MAG: DUF1577 domain-containing protein [Leptospira sp.]|jgi:hypothetical protein|nr:DUF1577 domain-containing protein [Leptospira sp.]NCS93057.1 DUF1577 domain-containing protein [Leptospira sp.]
MTQLRDLKPRIWKSVTEKELIDKLIIEKFSKEAGIIKAKDNSRPRAKFISKKPNGLYVIKLDANLDIEDPSASIYTTKEKQIELNFKIVQAKDDLLLIDPISIHIAEHDRRSKRITDLLGKVTGGNFLITKENLDESKIFGVSSLVLIQDIHKRLLHDFPNSKIILASQTSLSDEVESTFRNKKPIFITDTKSMTSLDSEGIHDLKDEYEEEMVLEDKIAEFKSKKISSFVIYPIIIPFGPNRPFAFLTLENDVGSIPESILGLYKEVESTFMARIMDSNTYTVDVKQNIINASLQGLAIEVNDPRIRNAISVKPVLTLDLNFKMQAPIRIALEVRHIFNAGEYDIIGCEIVGFSGDPEGLKKYKSYLEFIQTI